MREMREMGEMGNFQLSILFADSPKVAKLEVVGALLAEFAFAIEVGVGRHLPPNGHNVANGTFGLLPIAVDYHRDGQHRAKSLVVGMDFATEIVALANGTKKRLPNTGVVLICEIELGAWGGMFSTTEQSLWGFVFFVHLA